MNSVLKEGKVQCPFLLEDKINLTSFVQPLLKKKCVPLQRSRAKESSTYILQQTEIISNYFMGLKFSLCTEILRRDSSIGCGNNSVIYSPISKQFQSPGQRELLNSPASDRRLKAVRAVSRYCLYTAFTSRKEEQVVPFNWSVSVSRNLFIS